MPLTRNILLLLRASLTGIERRFLLSRRRIVSSGLGVFGCFGVDAGSVLGVFAGEGGEGGLGKGADLDG